ncbi:MAG: DNA polymerase III subunit delta [Gammaproteobacteria bacterium]|nr:DNA polymerase III subunit delta [Gammaproteobacteria bacterium]
MKLRARELQRHLDAGKLAAVYLVAGDEPLLVADALGEIRAAARKAGFEQRDLHVVDRSFRWDELASGADNLSLFASRKVLELRLLSPKPGDAGAKGLRELAAKPDPDRLLIVAVSGRVDGSAVWVKSLEKAGVQVEIWPIERAELPAWIRSRAGRYDLKLTAGAAELLAERVEGNLLAADQELAKLSLTGIRGEIDEARVLEAVADSARFDVFRLTDAVLEGDAARALRVLNALRAEGVQPVLVCWALARELGLLVTLKFAVMSRESLASAMGRQRVWRRRQPIIEKALKRFEWEHLTALLAQASEVDGIVKGAAGASPWDALTKLVLSAVTGGRPSRRGAV